MKTTALVVSALCLAAPGAAAQTTYNWNGSTRGMDQSREFAIASDHVVVLLHADYTDITLEDSEAPLNGASGPCFGKAEIQGGAAEGDGYCLWRDPEGELAVSRWTVTGMTDAGDLTGDWENVGGSGKWTEATGGGEWQLHQAEAGGPVELRFSGEGTIP
jgi:hypothetical protein